jgi:hypothetical protein
VDEVMVNDLKYFASIRVEHAPVVKQQVVGGFAGDERRPVGRGAAVLREKICTDD